MISESTPNEQEMQWLLRKRRGGLESSIKILGPFWSAQVKEMILNGALELEDEICPENGYWIALHEREEVKGALGVDPVARGPKAVAPSDHEATQPDLEQTDEITLAEGGSKEAPKPAPRPANYQRLSAPVIPKARAANPRFLGVEKGRYWGVLLVLITGAAAFGIVWLLRVLES